MGPDEVVLLRKAKLLFEDHFPGLVARFEQIEGEFLPVPWAPSQVVKASAKLRAITMSLAYRVRKPDVSVSLQLVLEVTETADGLVRRVASHSYHLGPSTQTDRYIIRLCEWPTQPHHFHLRGWEPVYSRGHIPANRADPPLSREPTDFMSVVEHYVQTKEITITVKK